MIKLGELKKILIIHGPNLNMLGKREPDIYGRDTLEDINSRLVSYGKDIGFHIDTFQSNHEGEIVDRIQAAMGLCDGIIINPAAYTHTSIAIRDALLLHTVPIIEVHLSNIYKRETFRHHSMIADIVTAQISGCGAFGYMLALEAMRQWLGSDNHKPK